MATGCPGREGREEGGNKGGLAGRGSILFGL